ncbi:hypothetical protein ACI4CU_28660, partial [Klebsiella pneumoniae]|uniref:hypothetical protein n=1 Tax=Klebsiella pneumoniae TaxID=573 RepID=UPI003854E61B
LNYFPDDAFLVKGSAEAAKAAEKLGFVRVVMPYHAGFKLERGLAEHAASVSLAPMEVSVQLAPGADVAVLAARFDEIYL